MILVEASLTIKNPKDQQLSVPNRVLTGTTGERGPREPQVNIAFHGTKSYRSAVKRAALDRNMTVHQLIELALQPFVEPHQ